MTEGAAGRKFSAGRALFLGFGGTAVLVGGVLGWSMLTSVSGAVIATGWVAAETRNRIVEHIDGGTVGGAGRRPRVAGRRVAALRGRVAAIRGGDSSDPVCRSHGYDDELHRVMVLARLEEQAIVVIIVDDAAAFDPTKAQEPEVVPTLEDGDIDGLGLGLLLVNRMMAGVAYRRRAGCNVVTLTKSIKDPEER